MHLTVAFRKAAVMTYVIACATLVTGVHADVLSLDVCAWLILQHQLLLMLTAVQNVFKKLY